MKVVLLAPLPPPAGGIASWTARMRNAKLAGGWKVAVVDEQVIGKRTNFDSRRNYLDEIRRCINIWKGLRNELRDPDAQIVHSCIPTSTLAMMRESICARISRLHKRKFVIHYHCTIPNMLCGHAGRLVFRHLTNLSDIAIALNTPSHQMVESHTDTPAVIIPNFVESHTLADLGFTTIRNQVRTILYLGAVVVEKGCNDIIGVARAFHNITFRMVGRVGMDISHAPANLVFCGELPRDAVEHELSNSDALIFPTHFNGEGFSIGLLEAMAKGLPCIVTDWAANSDMIENKGGIVVPIRNVNALINAVNTVVNDRALRQSQSEWNINKVRDNYLDTIVLPKYVRLYNDLLKSP